MAHVLLVTFNSQGNLNPFFRLAKRLSSKGLLVTLSSTRDIGRQISSSTGTPTNGDLIPIGKGHLRFEFFDDGWEYGDPRKLDINIYMPQLVSVGKVAIPELIRRQAELGRPVRGIISNPFVPWVLDVAEDIGIPGGILWVQSCVVFSIYYHYHHDLVQFPTTEKPDIDLSVPGVPTMKPMEIPSFLLPDNPYPSLTKALLAQFYNLSKAKWVLVNSFQELEGEVIAAISPRVHLMPVGPLIELGSNIELRGDLIETSPECMTWLDKQEPNSVVYASVGSIVRVDKEEMAEMAWGLKASKKKFLWVVREAVRDTLPEGFIEQSKENGLIVGWSPQDRVLQHKSVCCFLTHCGWNSTLETLSYGVPVITFPHWGDQPTDAKLLVDVYGVGVHLRNAERVNEKVSFTSGDVVRAVEEVTDGPKAEEIRDNVAKWKVTAATTMVEGGTSDRNLKAVVDEIDEGNIGFGFSPVQVEIPSVIQTTK